MFARNCKIMRKPLVVVFVFAAVCSALCILSSCDKGGDHHPTICFRVRSDSVSYSSSYLRLPHDTIFTVRLNASKTGTDGMLQSFKITKSVNGGADSVLLDARVTTVYLDKYYSYSAGDSGNIERYTFTIGNTEGLFGSIQFTDTVY